MYKMVNTYMSGIVFKIIKYYYINNIIIFAHRVNISSRDRVFMFYQIIMTHSSHTLYDNNMLYTSHDR